MGISEYKLEIIENSIDMTPEEKWPSFSIAVLGREEKEEGEVREYLADIEENSNKIGRIYKKLYEADLVPYSPEKVKSIVIGPIKRGSNPYMMY